MGRSTRGAGENAKGSGAVEVGNVGALVVAQSDRSEAVGKLLQQQPVEQTPTPRVQRSLER